MHYDTRSSTFCGIFGFYSYEPLKGYYPLLWYGKFYDMFAELPAEDQIERIYSLCGVNENGKVLAIVTHYTDVGTAEDKEIRLDFGKNGAYVVYLLDEAHTNELVATTTDLTFKRKNQSCILIKEV